LDGEASAVHAALIDEPGRGIPRFGNAKRLPTRSSRRMRDCQADSFPAKSDLSNRQL